MSVERLNNNQVRDSLATKDGGFRFVRGVLNDYRWGQLRSDLVGMGGEALLARGVQIALHRETESPWLVWAGGERGPERFELAARCR